MDEQLPQIPASEPAPAPVDEAAPVPVADIDAVAHNVLSRASETQRALTLGSYVLLAIALVSIVILMFRSGNQNATITSQQKTIATLVQDSQTEQHRIQAAIEQAASGSCQFYRVVGTLPVVETASPGIPQTNALTVSLIETAREAYFSFGCKASALAPPSPALRALGRQYHIKIT